MEERAPTRKSSPRSVTVLGATGPTGAAIVRRLVARGDIVTVLARSAVRAANLPPSVKVVIGDATDPAAVASAMDSPDVVFSAIGRRPYVRRVASVTVCDGATANVLRADATPEGVRYVVVSSVGMLLPDEQLLWYERAIVWSLRSTYPADFADRDNEARRLFHSRARWTLVRPSVLTPGRSGIVVAHPTRIVGPWATREGVAHYAVSAADDPALIGRAPYVASVSPRDWFSSRGAEKATGPTARTDVAS